MIDPKTLYPLLRKRVLITTKRGGFQKIKAHLWWIRENKAIFTPLDGGIRSTWPLEWIISIEPLLNEIITETTPANLKHAIGRKTIVTYTKGSHSASGCGRLQAVDKERLYQLTPSGNSVRVVPLPLISRVEVIA